MSARLRIAKGLGLPQDTVTNTMVIYGGKGMGKTNLGSVLVEELAAAGHRFSVLDPVGVWWGLQFAADGKGPGLEVLILGGKQGDIPIEPKDGGIVADLVADEDVNVIIDISRRADGRMWSIGDRIRFVTDYCIRLYERQGERRRPLHQVIDEAGRLCPQAIPHGSPQLAACVGAIERMVEEGRNVGIGVTLITQRSARMNKSVSELADCMIAFRTVGPRSVDAILDWFGEHVEKSRWKELVEKLRSLPRGHALVVSPGWLEFEGVAEIRPRNTFDSSSTPTGGGERKTTGKAAKPDLAAYKARMAETIERAKADDPKALRARIAQLEKEAKAKPIAIAAKSVEVKTVKRIEVPVIKAELVQRMESAAATLEAGAHNATNVLTLARQLIADARALNRASSETVRPIAATKPPIRETIRPHRETNRALAEPSEGVGGGLRKMMIALAQRPQGLNNKQLGLRAGLSSRSGTFSTYLGRGRSNGWIEGRGDLRITPAGLAALGEFEPLPTGMALADYWLNELGGGAARMLRALIDAYPNALSNDELGAAADVSSRSGTFSTYLGRMRGLELVTGRGESRASEEFFS